MRAGPKARLPFESMEVGQIRQVLETKPCSGQIKAAAYIYGKRNNKKFRTKKIECYRPFGTYWFEIERIA